jgi:hypothetical protein
MAAVTTPSIDKRGISVSAPKADWRFIGGFGPVTILIHFLTNGGYGYFFKLVAERQ